MIPELSNLCLYLALVFVLLQWLTLGHKGKVPLVAFSAATSVLVLLSFLGLIYCHATSDFSVLNVVMNSNADSSLIYKISGSWGNHEGSLLLWVLSLALIASAFAMMNYNIAAIKLLKTTLCIQGVIIAFFLVFIIFASNPFTRIFPTPLSGLGLNPVLQDIGLAFHPPIIYIGYVGFSIAYSAALAALIHGQVNADWIGRIRPWVLFSWAFLTLGIGAGSWWAYRELGWGGFWFWDPVENASLMPWLTGTALIHSLIISEKFGIIRGWTILTALLTFTLSLVGTFLVRSGIITSVHSFANDPKRGLFILVFLVVLTSASLFLYALRAPSLRSNAAFKFLSREFFIILNNFLLVMACIVVIFGTMYPLLLELITGDKISVGAPYFYHTFSPLVLILLLICVIGSQLNYQSTPFKKIYKDNRMVAITSLLLTAIIYYCLKIKGFGYELIGVWISVMLLLSTIRLYIVCRLSNKRFSISSTFCSMMLGHMGIAIVVLAISLNSALKLEREVVLGLNDSVMINDNIVKFSGLSTAEGQGFHALIAQMEVSKVKQRMAEKLLTILQPSIKYFPVQARQKSETDIYHQLFYDLYITIGDIFGDKNKLTVRIYYEPMMSCLWFGCLLVFFSGILGFLGKIYRYSIKS